MVCEILFFKFNLFFQKIEKYSEFVQGDYWGFEEFIPHKKLKQYVSGSLKYILKLFCRV